MLEKLKGLFVMVSTILAVAKAMAMLLEAVSEISRQVSSDPVLREKLTAAKDAAQVVADHKAE